MAGELLLLFADGGSGKGYIVLAGALALMTGRALGPFRPTRGGVRVAYLDWEADEPEIVSPNGLDCDSRYWRKVIELDDEEVLALL